MNLPGSSLPARLFGIRGRIDRKTYLLIGVSLSIFKYAVECVVLTAYSGQFFSPVEFLVPSAVLRQRFFETSPGWLVWVLVAWSIPFLWIAISMTVRRCADAGISPWWAFCMLLPLVNLVVMISMAIVPSRDSEATTIAQVSARNEEQASADNAIRMMGSALLGVMIGGLFALLLTAVSVYAVQSYGMSLFMGMPIVSGTAASLAYNQPVLRGLGASLIVGVLACLVGGLLMLLFAMEGAVCLVMALPLVAPLGLLGGLLGYGIAATILAQSRYMIGGVLFMLVPMFAWGEKYLAGELPIEMVESSIVINAPREEVWNHVISFPEITAPPEWYFRYGIASPLRARIEGEGVGAVRHCEFTTGSFVEPITVWDEPYRLAFDVTDQPEPLVELTPYRHIHPPHLEGTFLSVRGEFELEALSPSQTKLIGRTWYTVDMGPRIYWNRWTDWIIHRIHMRVLKHIQSVSES